MDISKIVALPMNVDEHGAIRVSGTRVTLDTIIARYHQGDSPETIHAGFNTVPLTDVYAVIAYYLAHQDEIDIYLHEREAEAARIRAEVEANYTPEQRARLERLRDQVAQKRRERASDH